MSDEDTSTNSNLTGGDLMGARLGVLESAISNIQQSVGRLLTSGGA